MREPCENCGCIPRNIRKRCSDCNELVCSSCWDNKYKVCIDCKPDFSELECDVCYNPIGRKKRKCNECGNWVHYPRCWNFQENCCKDCY